MKYSPYSTLPSASYQVCVDQALLDDVALNVDCFRERTRKRRVDLGWVEPNAATICVTVSVHGLVEL